MIGTTGLGKRIERDVATVADIKRRLRTPDNIREMTVMVIPKPGQDNTEVKGWRPIVLANTVGRWCKIVEQVLGQQ